MPRRAAWACARCCCWVLLLLAAAVIAMMPLAFPPLVSASFYSDTLIESRHSFALGELFVPANPFHAMANAIVPALVLFSTAVGLALIGVPGKAPLLASLRALEQAVVGVTRFVLALSPLRRVRHLGGGGGHDGPRILRSPGGLFRRFRRGLAAAGFRGAAAGGDGGHALSLPRSGGPVQRGADHRLRRQQCLHRAADAGGEGQGPRWPSAAWTRHDTHATVDIVVPIAFVVPNAGKLLTLLFVPFAAWLAGDPLDAASYLTLFAAGIPSYFAKAQVALPFLMDLLGVPHDLFQLYIPSSIVTGKFDSMVTVMSLLALALMTAAAVSGQLQLQARRIVPALLIMGATTGAAVVALRLLLGLAIDTGYHKDEVLRGMHLSRAALPLDGADRAARAAGRRARRRCSASAPAACCAWPSSPTACLSPSSTRAASWWAWTWTWPNGWPATWGRRGWSSCRPSTAGWTNCWPTAAPISRSACPTCPGRWPRRRTRCPIWTARWACWCATSCGRTSPAWKGMRARSPVTIGMLSDLPRIQQRLRDSLPGVDLRIVVLPSPQDFLAGKAPGVDAFVILAEAGAAWSLLYPAFSVVVPQPKPVAMPIGVAVRRGEHDLVGFVNDWLLIQRTSGELEEARDYWVLGRGAQPKPPRWSILHDVLGWGRPGRRGAGGAAPNR